MSESNYASNYRSRSVPVVIQPLSTLWCYLRMLLLMRKIMENFSCIVDLLICFESSIFLQSCIYYSQNWIISNTINYFPSCLFNSHATNSFCKYDYFIVKKLRVILCQRTLQYWFHCMHYLRLFVGTMVSEKH